MLLPASPLPSPSLNPHTVGCQAIVKMESTVPLPRLFMRCVIQATTVMPRLLPNTIRLLERLITQKVGDAGVMMQGRNELA